ncbi:MAG: FMN-binding negative transcriptional regulator [Candidatus Competibacter sp.]|nr:FMN-binding negative transcriptional regulator [Candidatus Competibacter sp.]
MYSPTHFDEPRIDRLHELMRAQPLATLVTLSSHGINADHLPLHLSETSGSLGALRGHVARANPIRRNLVENAEVLAIFQGSDAYITPSWYATKAETGKVVPTWNYVVVHAYGTLRFIDDAAWLRAHLEALVDHNESAFESPWRLSDAPPDYIEQLLGAVAGIEIAITRLAGKWKISQNQPSENQAGVIGGLRERGTAKALDMADLIERAN